ncbi:ATP-dependent nuclease [Pyruvatibacter mobilis]|uniref:ATP-dependent nuclease n=1 Tax=Pyruvatibacter mobilis TaxID=1712261 RepID=UPI003BA95A9E
MELVKSIHIQNFRSARDLIVNDLGALSSFCGVNNSGKSNILKALNLFFNNETDPGDGLDFEVDYNKSMISRKQKRKISVGIKFSLPKYFNFRKELAPVEALLGSTEFSIKKTWDRLSPDPEIYLSGQLVPETDIYKIRQFLDLIKFRYIPNRISPLEIVRSEQSSVADALVKRLKISKDGNTEAFDKFAEQATALTAQLIDRFSLSIPDFATVRLNTPKTWADLIFQLAYQFGDKGEEVDDARQGSGSQSVLMIETLRLVDEDYYKRFGWRQATIWGFEEPETSLHHGLQTQIADLLGHITRDGNSRLQILTTTHSNPILQASDSSIHVMKEAGNSTIIPITEDTDFFDVWSTGVAPWQHPILINERAPLILVEGKTDYTLFRLVQGLVPGGLEFRIGYLNSIDPAAGEGGDDHLVRYLRQNISAVEARPDDAPVIVVFDWDAAKRQADLSKKVPSPKCLSMIWQAGDMNPELGDNFRGIERALSSEFLLSTAADLHIDLLKKDGVYRVHPDDWGALKSEISKRISRGIEPNHLEHIRLYFSRLVEDWKSGELPKLV